MWIFELLDASGGVKGTLPVVEGIYTLGRKGSSISFANDRSVSRKHAEVRVGPVPGNDPFKQPIFVKDVGSKLKTSVNGADTGDANHEVSLREGDLLKVGTTASVMRLRFQALRLCGTQLSAEDKAELKRLVKSAGGTVARKWDTRCTHLVSPPAVTFVTEKLVLAVADVRPVIHVGWVKALVEGASAKPLRPAPDTARFGLVVTRGRGTFAVRDNPYRRTHLSGNFFVALHKDETIDRIVEAAGGGLCRAYAMSDSDFASQDWERWAAQRKPHYIQTLPEEKVTPEISAAIATRSERLEKLGMEATTKRQLAEAVVYLQPLVSVSEAMRAGGFGTAAGIAWGPSQSLASQVPPTPAPARAPVPSPMPVPRGVANPAAATAAMATGAGARAADAPPVPSKSAAVPKAPAQRPPATAAVPPAPLETPVVVAAAGGETASARRVEESSGRSCRRVGRGGAGLAEKKGKGKGANVSREVVDDLLGEAEPDAGAAEAATTAAKAAVVSEEGGGAGGKNAGALLSQEGGAAVGGAVKERGGVGNGSGVCDDGGDVGMEDKPAGTGKRKRAAVGVEAVSVATGGGGGGGGGERPATKRKKGEPEKEAEEPPAPKKKWQGQDQEPQPEPAPEPNRDPPPSRQAERHHRGGDDATRPHPPDNNPNKKNAQRESPSTTPPESGRAVELVDEDGAGSPPKGLSEGGSQRSIPVPVPVPSPTPLTGGGWLTAHNALSLKEKNRRGESGGGGSGGVDGKEKRGRRGRAEGDMRDEKESEVGEEGPEEPTPPPEAALTEQRRLVARAYSRTGPDTSRSGGRGRGGPLVPNFKRFRKNSVIFGGEGLGEYVPMSLLRSIIPKESERELVLAAEQRQLEDEKAVADRLFSQDMRGGRAPRGRTKRR